MIVNFDIELMDFNGDLIIAESPNGLQSTVSLRGVLQKALFFGKNPYLTSEEKVIAYRLPAKMNDPKADYTEEEIEIIRKVAEMSLETGIYGQLLEIIKL